MIRARKVAEVVRENIEDVREEIQEQGNDEWRGFEFWTRLEQLSALVLRVGEYIADLAPSPLRRKTYLVGLQIIPKVRVQGCDERASYVTGRDDGFYFAKQRVCRLWLSRNEEVGPSARSVGIHPCHNVHTLKQPLGYSFVPTADIICLHTMSGAGTISSRWPPFPHLLRVG